VEGPPVSVAGAELSRRRDAADHRARVENERGIQRYRTWALLAGVGQGLIYPTDRAVLVWVTLGALAVSVVGARWSMARHPGPTALRRLSALTMGIDIVLIGLFLANALRDPTDPIQMLPLSLAAEGAVRWGRIGGMATGAAAGVMAATWSVVVHARQDIVQPLAFVTFRVVAVVIIGSLLGSTVSAVRRQRRLADMVCNASSDLIVSFDLHGTVRTVNPACEAILGYTQDELIGTDRAELVHGADKPDGPPDLESLRRLGSRHVELQFTHKAGHSAIRSIVGANDLVVRLAGDEFCVLLAAPVADDAARHVATSIADALAEPFHVGHAGVRLTASVGRAASTPVDRPADLLERADQAMYVAKRMRVRPARQSTDGAPPGRFPADAASSGSPPGDGAAGTGGDGSGGDGSGGDGSRPEGELSDDQAPPEVAPDRRGVAPAPPV
jgi:PAS domain S-box-containing protein